MKLLMMSWRGPKHPKAGGAEIYTERVLGGLAARGYDVTWYSAGMEGSRPDSYGGIKLEYGAQGMSVYPAGYVHSWLARKKYDLILDQINTFGFMTPLVPLQAARVAFIHQLAYEVWNYETTPPLSWIGRPLEKACIAAYRQVPFLTVSPSTLEDLLQAGWKGPHEVAPNGVELGACMPKTAHPTLVFLARFGARAKRLEHAVQAFLAVREQYPDAELRIIGRGEPPAYVRETPGISIYPNVSDGERNRLLAEAWCCVATSVREGWGRMVLEAAAVGTTSVVYRVAGLRDAVQDGRTGIVVPEDPKEMAKAVLRIIGDPSYRDALSAQAYELAGEYTWERTVDIFDGFLQQTLERHGRNTHG
ncbi:glycosyltransferase family 4 protein [Gorillibacterium sp. sgz5001074]|uniref:glycosyltransferase family 4 protein n=1 Tax=Gorillibacterium sp. sgz5001074 TaxID=3446695 RepID=UPI003F66C52A